MERMRAMESGRNAKNPLLAEPNFLPGVGLGIRPRATGRPSGSRTSRASKRVPRLSYLTFADHVRPSHDLPTALRDNDGLGERINANITRRNMGHNPVQDKDPARVRR